MERQKTRKSENNANVKLKEITHDLYERIKELNCLYGISRLVEKQDISLDDILYGVLSLIPPAWQYPEITHARIKLKSKEYFTVNFQQSGWVQSESIIVNGKPEGKIQVYYVEKRPYIFEGPFLKEERDLIHGIAERLGHIIESKTAEKALTKLYAREKYLHRKLQREMQSRVDFTRLLVHELKTPLTSLVATSQLLEEETRKTKLEKLSAYVLQGANQLNNRINDLHDMIRGEMGNLKIVKKRLNINDLCSSIVEEMMPVTLQYNMTVKVIAGIGIPPVSADAERVRQIIYNLIINACKYANNGRKIDLVLSYLTEEKKGLCEIRDYGTGIPNAKKRRLFKPEYNRNIEQPGGLGIGLALCKMLVDLHQGSIWVESNRSHGTSVYFTLPEYSAEK